MNQQIIKKKILQLRNDLWDVERKLKSLADDAELINCKNTAEDLRGLSHELETVTNSYLDHRTELPLG